MRLESVSACDVTDVWSEIAPLVEQACKRSPADGDAQAMRGWCEAGANQLWLVRDGTDAICGVAITGIVDGVCVWNAVAGKGFAGWRTGREPIEQWAKQQGCHAMRLYGRPGWSRQLKADGYAVRGVIMERAL